jgi:hypothetical protein
MFESQTRETRTVDLRWPATFGRTFSGDGIFGQLGEGVEECTPSPFHSIYPHTGNPAPLSSKTNKTNKR